MRYKFEIAYRLLRAYMIVVIFALVMILLCLCLNEGGDSFDPVGVVVKYVQRIKEGK